VQNLELSVIKQIQIFLIIFFIKVLHHIKQNVFEDGEHYDSTRRRLERGKEDEMGKARSKYARGFHIGFWWKSPIRRRPLERPRCRWEDNIKIGEIGWGGIDWIHLSEDRDNTRGFVNTIMNLQVQ
jgi:hypothetical protein